MGEAPSCGWGERSVQHRSPAVDGGDVEVLAFVHRRLAFLEAAFGHGFEGELLLLRAGGFGAHDAAARGAGAGRRGGSGRCRFVEGRGDAGGGRGVGGQEGFLDGF